MCDSESVDEEIWERLFATERSQQLLEQLAQEALELHRRGETRPMQFTLDGKIRPGENFDF